jgi:hypothetical protein
MIRVPIQALILSARGSVSVRVSPFDFLPMDNDVEPAARAALAKLIYS